MSSCVPKFTLHVNSYSNAYVCIQVLHAQMFMFTRGTLDKIIENSCLAYWVVIGVWCMSRWS